jgi:hypothetical protein
MLNAIFLSVVVFISVPLATSKPCVVSTTKQNIKSIRSTGFRSESCFGWPISYVPNLSGWLTAVCCQTEC